MFQPQSILVGVCVWKTTSDSEEGQSEIIMSPNTLQLQTDVASFDCLLVSYKKTNKKLKCRYSRYFTWNSDMKRSASALFTYFILCTSASHICSLIVPRSPDSAITPQQFFKLNTEKSAAPSPSAYPVPTSGQGVHSKERRIWKALLSCQWGQEFPNADLWTKFPPIPSEIR